jgi:hypothetical protein
MPHVTLIHGISNKPPPEDLLRIWRETLANAAEPLPLGDLGVTSSLVYWADLLHEKPDEDLSAYEGVLENWVNVFDRLDPVCGFDPELANDFRKSGAATVEDFAVQNDGAWRHSITKYLRQPRVCQALRRVLKLV